MAKNIVIIYAKVPQSVDMIYVPAPIVPTGGDAAEVCSVNLGVVGTTRYTLPKESICFILPSLFKTGTERERCIGSWHPPFCIMTISVRSSEK